ncbi:hypothetical protein E3T46_03445 [Cryobacterium sp. Hh11]|uniref:hypothetical protein n=1 Tax=Cryobacterium sp. Hh11 TaxID=2555868 RepID=UPI00106D01F6|nr:hypothetical protein [Cryobacterium sp. Hh11]TFD53382.1 hypothetical protein E3T46_03445 [Cryobacterium sp. Hh11]
MRKNIIRRTIAAGLSLVVLTSLLQLSELSPASALTGADFQAGNIISDQNFYDASAMSQDQIQSFLDARVGVCQNTLCLNVLRVDTPTKTLSFGTCDTYAGEANESAARVIFKVQRACAISAKVILATLQKEQTLVTRTAPSEAILRKAMGYECPDSASCNPAYFGFFLQVFGAARQLAWYGNSDGSFTSIKIGQQNAVRFHPNTACGSSNVLIQNRATAALYYYTPYQPNSSALENLGGVGDGCSAYGNRNFWVHYTNWFGPTTGPPLDPIGNLEVAAASVNSATFRGWTFDPEIAGPISVHLYLNGQWGGAFEAAVPRPDIAKAYPSYGPNHGFAFSVPLAVGAGAVQACLYAINVGIGSNQLLACKTVTTPTGPPFGTVDSATLTDGIATVSGWVIDPDSPASTTVQVYVNGTRGEIFAADAERADVARAYPGYGSKHGFSAVINVGVGTNTICIDGVNIAGGVDRQVSCATVSSGSGPPIGNIESAKAAAGQAIVSGWGLDPDTTDPIVVHAYVNGKWGGSFTASGVRADVGRAYPGYGDSRGFSMSVPVPGGSSEVCLFGINVGRGFNSSLGCAKVIRPTGTPFGNFESAVTSSTGMTTISGWTIDPDTTSPVNVHVYFNGRWGGSFAANTPRNDVDRAYPAFGAEHGFSIPVTLESGSTQVCVFAISTGAGANQDMGCKTVLK